MRHVIHTDNGPYVLTGDDVDPEHGDIAVCRCGLSPEFPFCDGSHRVTEDEDPDTVYRYPDGPDGERQAVAGSESREEAGRDDDPVGERCVDEGCVVAVHAERVPRIVQPEEIDTAGGRLELRLADLAVEVLEDRRTE